MNQGMQLGGAKPQRLRQQDRALSRRESGATENYKNNCKLEMVQHQLEQPERTLIPS